MSLIKNLVTGGIYRILRMICRIEDAELEKVPTQGPLIVAVNHVNFLDAPLIYTHLAPRPVTAFIKKETWKNPALGALFSLWGAIPIRRGEADLTAFEGARQALVDGKILVISPEGTRSGNGVLKKGRPGLVLLAYRTKTPLQPVIYYGAENIWQNLGKLKRTDFHIRVGKPFMLKTNGKLLSKELCEEMITEIMYQLAALLPPQFRGVYSDLSLATTNYLDFSYAQ
jgi:1-acyl-sn-glycerol-3-phosphate acyltransferase